MSIIMNIVIVIMIKKSERQYNDVLNGMIDHNEEKKAAEELNNTGREIEGFHYSVSETNTLDNVIRKRRIW